MEEHGMWNFMGHVVNYLFHDFNDRLDVIIQSQLKMEKMIMGIKEDFVAFTVAVNERTNEIGVALDEIKLDIEGLLNPATPPEMVTAMTEITGKLQLLSDTSKAIAALNNPVVPPPVEPPA